MALDGYIFRQIDAETTIKSFDCGDADLNDFLLSDAIDYYKSMMAVTYLLEDKDNRRIVAYYSLLNDKIVFNPEDKRLWNKLNRRIKNPKRRKEYPAVKIGRFAVSKEYAGQNIGITLLLGIQHLFVNMQRSACRFLTVDAYSNAIPFYEKCGFTFLSEHDMGKPTRAMYFDLMDFPKDVIK